MPKCVTLLAVVASLLAGCGTSMRLPSSSLKIGVNADPRLDWSFERIARIDRVKDRKEETRFHTPELTPGEKTFSVLVSRERRGAPGEPATKTSERREYNLLDGALVSTREFDTEIQERSQWLPSHYYERGRPHSLEPAKVSGWRLEADRAWTLINLAAGGRHVLFSEDEHVAPIHTVAFSPDGTYLIAWFDYGPNILWHGYTTTPHVRVWTVADGALIAWWTADCAYLNPSIPLAFADGHHTLVLRASDYVEVFDLERRVRVARLHRDDHTIVTSDGMTVINSSPTRIEIYRLIPANAGE